MSRIGRVHNAANLESIACGCVFGAFSMRILRICRFPQAGRHIQGTSLLRTYCEAISAVHHANAYQHRAMNALCSAYVQAAPVTSPEAMQQRVALLKRTLAEMEETDRALAVLKEEIAEMRRRETRDRVDLTSSRCA